MPDSSVEEERRLALDRLRQLAAFYEKPEAAQLMQQFQSRANGQDSPYGPDVVNSQLADNSDASAGQVRNERGMIDRAFGNAGLAGSGLQASAHMNSQRRASALARQGRRDITSRASLANYQAKERASQDVLNYLQVQQGAQERAGMAEVGFRSQAREITDAPPQAMAGAAPAGNSSSGDRVNPQTGLSSGFFAQDPNSLRMINTTNSYGGAPTSNGGGFAPAWQAMGHPSPQYGSIMRQFGL